MSENQNTGIALNGQQFSIGGNLDVDAVLTVATSRAEIKFNTELAAAKRVAKEAATAYNKAVKDKEIAIRVQGEIMAEAKASQIRTAIKDLGGRTEIAGNTNLNGDDKVTAIIQIKDTKGYGVATFLLNEAPNTTTEAKIAEAERAAEAKTQAEEVALSWRRKLNNVPVLERQMKARIAETKLSDTEEGRKMLEALTDGLDDAIMALPEA